MTDAFLSCIIHAKKGSACTGARLNVMTQALHPEDGSLPQGLTIQNAYSEMCNGSRNVSIIVRYSRAYPQTLKKEIPVARAVAANWVPESQMCPGMIEAWDKPKASRCWSWSWSKDRRSYLQSCIWGDCNLGHQSWQIPPSLFWLSIMTFSPKKPSELGCTHSIKHMIKVTDDISFKERFRQIPLLLAEEVHTYFWEMLDSDAIHPSQSVWCNAALGSKEGWRFMLLQRFLPHQCPYEEGFLHTA